MSSDLKMRSSELICWLTADCVTLLICAALVKLSVSARSQKTFKLSICIRQVKQNWKKQSTGLAGRQRQLDFAQQFGAREGLLQVAGAALLVFRQHVATGGHHGQSGQGLVDALR